jgi:hypothetical protein
LELSYHYKSNLHHQEQQYQGDVELDSSLETDRIVDVLDDTYKLHLHRA